MPTVKVTHRNHSHTVEADSAHEAALRYKAFAAGTPSLGLQRFNPGEVLTVETPDGQVVQVTHDQACQWGAREAERRMAESAWQIR